ncbi:T9SS type A sorting domain-containing protein, partial [Bacteroidales bacterium OttesenSCG-928-L19]|nr:T9SS type A sorting domain-containing protein [Bacteroidales bacterium OttesenSCG-928-L19]
DPYLIQGDVMQGSLTRQQGEEAGEYYILQGTLDHDQYEIIYVRAVYLISHINIEISQEGETIVAEERNATYQWLDCDRQFEAIPGATQRQFAPQEEGNYAVRLEKGACIDTSESIYFKPSGINENISPTIILFPNPVYDQLNIHVGEKCNSDYVIHIYNSEGKKVEQLTMKGLLNFTIPFQHPQGLYYIHLISNHKNSVIQKVIKIAQ